MFFKKFTTRDWKPHRGVFFFPFILYFSLYKEKWRTNRSRGQKIKIFVFSKIFEKNIRQATGLGSFFFKSSPDR